MLCANCGTKLPTQARFCAACGTPISPDDGGRMPGGDPVRCEIRLWRGYVKAQFLAEIYDPELGARRAETSKAFWWRSDDPPPVSREDVSEAYAGLVARLVALGWEPSGQAGPWYGQVFERRDRTLLAADDATATARRRRVSRKVANGDVPENAESDARDGRPTSPRPIRRTGERANRGTQSG